MILSVFIAGCAQTVPVTKDEVCDYGDRLRNYVGKNADECSRIQALCVPGFELFEDDCGCGCQVIGGNTCTAEQKQADACIEIYQPACGWDDPEKVQCIKYPCAQTYSNSCFACIAENVLYWTEGECPDE